MNTQKTARLLALLSGMAMISMTAAQAAQPVKSATINTAVMPPAVTVKLGPAMLEEYHGGDPATRTTILRGGDVAQKAKTGDGGKKRS